MVRFRIDDGRMKDVIEPRRALHAALVSRIKGDGNAGYFRKALAAGWPNHLRIAGRPVDVRRQHCRPGHGERVVLRLLDKSMDA